MASSTPITFKEYFNNNLDYLLLNVQDSIFKDCVATDSKEVKFNFTITRLEELDYIRNFLNTMQVKTLKDKKYYDEVFYAEVFYRSTGEICFVFSDLYVLTKSEFYVMKGIKGGIDEGEVIDIVENTITERLTGILEDEIHKKFISDTIDEQISNAVLSTLLRKDFIPQSLIDNIANRVINALSLNGQELIYRPQIAKVTLLQDGAVVPLELLQTSDNVLTGKLNLQGEYEIQIDTNVGDISYGI